MLAFTRPEQDLPLEKKVGGSNINLQFSISNDGFTKELYKRQLPKLTNHSLQFDEALKMKQQFKKQVVI